MRHWVIGFICLPQLLLAQEPEGWLRSGVVEEQTEAAVADLESQQLRLEYYRRHPLDINRATADELAELGLLSAMQINAWVQFRSAFGWASDWNVFQSVPGWSEATVNALKPYVRFGVAGLKYRDLLLGPMQHWFLYRVNWKDGSDLPKQAAGGRAQVLFRYQFYGLRGVRAGFLMEKDPGETFWRRGPDFWSVYVFWKSKSNLSWILGDFTIQYGQGLSCWQAMSFGAGSDLAAVKRQGAVMRGYQSVGESRFMRGLSVGRLEGRLRWQAFASAHPQTATVYQIPSVGNVFRQVDASGLHRTVLEYSKKNALCEYTAGGRVGKFFSRGSVFLNAVARRWSLPKADMSVFVRDSVKLERSRSNVSLDMACTRGPAHVFGEWAMDASGNMAGVFGTVIALGRVFDATIHLRNVGRGFRSVDGQPFQQASTVQAEFGMFLQARWRIGSSVTVDAYVDRYQFPSSLSDLFSRAGMDQAIRWQYQPDKKSLIYLRIQSSRADQVGGVGTMSAMLTKRIYAIRLHGQFSFSDRMGLSFRGEQLAVSGNGFARETGFLAYAEMNMEFPSSGCKVDMRAQWVATDGWGSRIYAYERDVMYKTGFPAFYGNQLRFYVNFTLPVGKNCTAWLRYDFTKSVDFQSFEQIPGLTRAGYTLQLRYTLGGSVR